MFTTPTLHEPGAEVVTCNAAGRALRSITGDRLRGRIKIPLVTVIITNYNYADYLADAIESVLQQTYARVECLIVDDCSTDASREHIEDALQQAGRPDFRAIFLDENIGQLGAMKVGVDAAKGVFVNFLDSDDILMPDFIETHVKAHLNTGRSASVSASDTIQIDADGQILECTSHNLLKDRSGDAPLSGSPLVHSLPHSSLPAFTGDEMFLQGRSDSLFYIDRSFAGWPVVACSALVFRRNVLALAFPADLSTGRICADYYLYHLAHGVGGTLTIGSAHSFYRFHQKNNFSQNPVVGGFYAPGTTHQLMERRLDAAIAYHITSDVEFWTRLLGAAKFSYFVKQGLFKERAPLV